MRRRPRPPGIAELTAYFRGPGRQPGCPTLKLRSGTPNQEIAAVATYVRNSWGNRAPAISVSQVADLRKRRGLQQPRYTDNPGDQH